MKILIFISIFLAAVGLSAAQNDRQGRHTNNFRHFYNLTEIEHYIEHLAEEHPDLVSAETIGVTSEGRDIYAVHVRAKNNTGNQTAKPIILVESGLRPREWIGIMVNIYLIHMFAEHPDYQYLLKNVDLIFVPVANPDGFVYTQTTDRKWNKNRRNISSNCTGVDLNRNFDFQFKANNSNCKQDFAGLTAASEAETQAIQNLVKKNQKQIKLYLSLQAFGNQILTPYSYARVNYPENRRLQILGYNVAAAIRRTYGRWYQVGQGARLLRSPEFGTSTDYAFGAAKIPAAFTIKLPRGGPSGFEVPANQLDRILSETFPGFLDFVKFVGKPNRS